MREPSFDTVVRMMAMCCDNTQFEQLANLAALLLSDLDDPQNNNPAQVATADCDAGQPWYAVLVHFNIVQTSCYTANSTNRHTVNQHAYTVKQISAHPVRLKQFLKQYLNWSQTQ